MRYDMNIVKESLGNTVLPTKPVQRCAGFALCTRCAELVRGRGEYHGGFGTDSLQSARMLMHLSCEACYDLPKPLTSEHAIPG